MNKDFEMFNVFSVVASTKIPKVQELYMNYYLDYVFDMKWLVCVLKW